MDKYTIANFQLPTLLLLTAPCSANGLGNDKAAHITASAAAGIVLAQNKPFNRWKPWQPDCKSRSDTATQKALCNINKFVLI